MRRRVTWEVEDAKSASFVILVEPFSGKRRLNAPLCRIIESKSPPDYGSLKPVLFNPFLNKPWILPVCGTSLENTAGKREIAL